MYAQLLRRLGKDVQAEFHNRDGLLYGTNPFKVRLEYIYRYVRITAYLSPLTPGSHNHDFIPINTGDASGLDVHAHVNTRCPQCVKQGIVRIFKKLPP